MLAAELATIADPIEHSDVEEQERRTPPPGGVIQRFTSRHGGTIRYATWKQPGGEPRARVFMLHGRTEFIEKHHETLHELIKRDFEVWTFDWRGQGLSSRELSNHHKGHVRSFDHYVDDLAKLIEMACRRHGGGILRVPNIILAQSMGAHVALRFALQHPTVIDRMMLCATMVEIKLPPWKRMLARPLSGLARRTGFSGAYALGTGDYTEEAFQFEGNVLTSDPARFYDTPYWVRRNQELALGGPTYGWLRAALESIRQLHQPDKLAKLTIPIRMISAGLDTIVTNRAQATLARKLPEALHLEIANARHELLHESDLIRKLVWEQFDQLVNE